MSVAVRCLLCGCYVYATWWPQHAASHVVPPPPAPTANRPPRALGVGAGRAGHAPPQRDARGQAAHLLTWPRPGTPPTPS